MSESYFNAVNQKFSKLKLRAAEFKSTEQFVSLSKTDVLLSGDILALAGGDPGLAAQLEKRLGEIPDAADALIKKFESDFGRTLKKLGFLVDKKGDIYCAGKVKNSGGVEKDFRVKLCSLNEKSVSLSARMLRNFDSQAFGLDIVI